MTTAHQPLMSDPGWARRILPKVLGASVALAVILTVGAAAAANASIEINTAGGTDGNMGTLELLFLFAFIALAPSMLILMTSFTRIVIVFSFLRSAIGLQQTPPNQVIIGLSLALSLFIMQPVLSEINTTAIDPYMKEEITQEVALERMQVPIKAFMLKETRPNELNLFLNLDGKNQGAPISAEGLTDLGLHILVPAFVTSELKQAFTMGFLLYLPFLVIDMVVSSTLMSMGMVMLPPSMISLPFKLMLFVVVDGWAILMDTLVKSFLQF